MPMNKVPRSEPISKAVFHQRLREWVEAGNEKCIGDPDVPGVTPWLMVTEGDHRFRLHADTAREGVVDYLRLVTQFGDTLAWTVVPNQRGHENAVAFGPDAERPRHFYLYLDD